MQMLQQDLNQLACFSAKVRDVLDVHWLRGVFDRRGVSGNFRGRGGPSPISGVQALLNRCLYKRRFDKFCHVTCADPRIEQQPAKRVQQSRKGSDPGVSESVLTHVSTVGPPPRISQYRKIQYIEIWLSVEAAIRPAVLLGQTADHGSTLNAPKRSPRE
jgi:hypothetical protein